MDRLMVIAADSHAGLPTAMYKEYLETEHHAELAAQLGEKRTIADVMRQMVPSGSMDDGTSVVKGAGDAPRTAMDFSEDITTFAQDAQAFARDIKERIGDISDEELLEATMPAISTGQFVRDPDRRIKEVEEDGVVAEVLYPQLGIPFQGDAGMANAAEIFGAGVMDYEPPMRAVGARAHNRWLAEFCHKYPDRLLGLATLATLYDVDEAIADIRTAAEGGLRGVLLHPAEPGVPYLYDERYEPLWATCDELGLPVHFHVGAAPTYGNSPAGLAVLAYEIHWWAHRPLWFLMFGGVFERYPNLNVVFSEQGMDWVPSALLHMDARYEASAPGGYLRETLKMKPSEYWERQCFLGSLPSRAEIDMRDKVGVSTVMFGTDFPHKEGTWPHTRAYLHALLSGCSEAEARLISGENQVRCYNLDASKLKPVAERVGPKIEEVIGSGGDDLVSAASKRSTRAAQILTSDQTAVFGPVGRAAFTAL